MKSVTPAGARKRFRGGLRTPTAAWAPLLLRAAAFVARAAVARKRTILPGQAPASQSLPDWAATVDQAAGSRVCRGRRLTLARRVIPWMMPPASSST
jgi:hypothetical protein